MTIVEDTPERLILEHVPWRDLAFLVGCMTLFFGIAVLFIVAEIMVGGLIFLIIGAGPAALSIYLTVARSQLIFDRSANTVDHRRRSFRGTTRHPIPLDKVKRIYVAKNGETKAWLFLEVIDTMDAGHHPFPKETAAVDDVVTAKARVDEWLTE